MADPRSLRLIFEFDGDQVNLVSRQPVDMLAPSSESLDDLGDQAGSWAEVHSREGAVLHRQVLHNPLNAIGSEVFSSDPQESLRRVTRRRQQGAFTVVVPDLPGSDQVAIVAEGVAPTAALPEGTEGAASAPRRGVLRFSLHGNDPGQVGHDNS